MSGRKDSSGTYSARCRFTLTPFLGERLDDVDADDALLRHRRDVGHLLLDVAQDRVRDGRVPVGHDHDQRRDRGCRERQAPVRHVHHRGDADDGRDVLEEEDQPVAEEEADSLQVDRRARHQLPRLMPVVEPEREPLKLRVEAVPHVELDCQRLAAGDQAPAHHQQRPHEPGGEDPERDPPDRLAAPAARRFLKPISGQECHHDRGRLRADGERDRDDQRPLVRLQKAEQAKEGLPIGRSLVHRQNLAVPLSVPETRYARSGER